MKTIKQTILLNASAQDIYDILINAKKLTKITGGKATNTEKVGGKFTAYDDYVTGTNIEFTPREKIMQKWTCQDFPPGHFTDVTIELKKKSDKQTELILTQTNVPDDFYEDINEGWNQFYWEPIKDYLEDLMWK